MKQREIYRKNKTKFGIKKEITHEDIHKMKQISKRRLINDRDCFKTEIKSAKKQLEELKTIYNPETMTKVQQKREEELRSTIYHISKFLHNRKDNIQESTVILYEQIYANVNEIYTKLVTEINEKRDDIMERINLRLADCDYRQKKMLNDKIQEQEGILRNLHAFTYDMQRVKENYEIIRKKINSLYEEDYDLEQKIKDENNRYNQIYFLLKQMKEETMIKKNEVKLNKHIQKMENGLMKGESMTISSKFNKSRPKTSIPNIDTETCTTNYYLKTDPMEKNCIQILQKQLKEINEKKRNILRVYDRKIPQNELYTILTDMIDKKKFEINTSQPVNKQIKELPLQNHDFRKQFMNNFLNDPYLINILNDEKYPVITIFNQKLLSR